MWASGRCPFWPGTQTSWLLASYFCSWLSSPVEVVSLPGSTTSSLPSVSSSSSSSSSWGLSWPTPHNWSGEEGGFAPFGFSGIMTGAATCFYAFAGFGAIAASSVEARNPKRTVPMALAISVGVVAGAYILVSTVLTLMVPWHNLDPDSALADAFHQQGHSWAAFIVVAGAICAIITLLLNILLFVPRMVCAMSADGLFFQVFLPA
uniref:Amino acid permease/ SLC12A domain-containing protein n=1 Tax=Equus asinus TaxID=9793 RepID=A0A9L0J1N3_EQUAS